MSEVIQKTGEMRPRRAAGEVVRAVNDATTDVATTKGGRVRHVGVKGLKIVERMAAGGHTDHAIARALGMERTTFRLCRRRQPEVDEALQRGRSTEEHQLVAKLHEAAMKGNVVAAIFLLKSRHGYRDQGTAAEERPNIVIQLPDAADPDSYMRRVNARLAPPEAEEKPTWR